MAGTKAATDIDTGGRLGAPALVLLLIAGLLFSLIQCVSGDLPFSSGKDSSAKNPVTVAMQVHLPETAPGTSSDHQLPCHSGHCVAHVTIQPATGVSLPAALVLRAQPYERVQFHASSAGLSLFRPPRA